MKKIAFFLALSILLLSSCTTVTKTARTAEMEPSLYSATVADLVPTTDERITYTMEPSKAIQRGGIDNIKNAVEAEALAEYGNADVLLEPQYVISKQQGLLRNKVSSITVSGRPAYYTNFRSLNDSVWCNAAFRGVSADDCHYSSFYLMRNRNNNALSSTQTGFSKGFTKKISPFVGYSSDYYGGFTCGALLDVGYQLNPYLSVGAGFGLDFYDFILERIPLYADVRLNLSKQINTLFLDLKLGADLYYAEVLGGFAAGYSFGKMDIAFQCLSYGFYDTEFSLSFGFNF